MVDVGDKQATDRQALACGAVLLQPATLAAIAAGDAPKGDVLGTARLAGILAAKRTAELIPLCHPLALTAVQVDLALVPTAADDPRCCWQPGLPTAAVVIQAAARVRERTGVEMEALTAVAVAALTVYDMAKALDRTMVVQGVRLLEKSGGRHTVRVVPGQLEDTSEATDPPPSGR
ncbi:MAG: cyclic pyranopterin monophosphate synthase MoaC [Fimbriimonadaceae bacterium]|nr:cyclic pyranopterin monophosphate synthase MoaC [Fimbriimonadaceae bacterium]